MSETPVIQNSPAEDPEMTAFFNELEAFLSSELKGTIRSFLLVNPNRAELNNAARKAFKNVPTGVVFDGFRGIKFFNSQTQETRCFVWPSFYWSHYHVIHAAHSLTGFEVVGGNPRFGFDVGNAQFSDDALASFEQWRDAPESIRTPDRGVRQDD